MPVSRIAMLPTVPEKELDKSLVDVAEEVKKIVTDHGSTLLRIQLVIVLPITAMMMLSDFIFQKFANTLLPVPPPLPRGATDNLATFGRHFPPVQMFRHILLSFQTSQVTLTMIAAIALGWFNLFLSVHYIAANVHAVISFHNKKSLTFMDVLQMVPKLRNRLMVTGYWGYLLTFGASLPFLVFDNISYAFWISLAFGLFLGTISFVATFYISPIYQVANCIACCEENTGLTAFTKSINLLDRKSLLKPCFFVELLLRGLWSAASTVVGGVHRGPLSYGFSIVAEMLLNSLITELAIVCWTVVYIWIKEYHDESVDFVAVREDQFRGPFQRIGTVKQSALDVETAGVEGGN